MANFNDKGEQIPDQTPLAVPVGFGAPTDLTTLIQTLVRVESKRAAEAGEETFEESDDFDVDEDSLHTPYQLRQMQEEAPREAKFIEPPEQKTKPAADPKADADYQQFLQWKAEQAKKTEQP